MDKDPKTPQESDYGAAGAPLSVEPSVDLLHARYRERLRNFFAKRLGSISDVEDLIQETFLRLAKPERLTGIENVEAYVFQVASNLILERGRRRAVRHAESHVELTDELEDVQVFSPERILTSREDLACVVRALQELPERTRAIFVLQRFEGLTYVEIARRFGVTHWAIEKQMTKAIAHLAKRLEETK